jgi:hypothetical protein
MVRVLEMLEGGDLRSIGRANEVTRLVCHKPQLLPQLFEGLYSEDSVVRARSADALEKVSIKFPEYLEPFKSEILRNVSKIDQQEVKWHVALIIPRLSLSEDQRDLAKKILLGWLDREKSNIVRVCSLQALHDLSAHDIKLKKVLTLRLKELSKTGSPSLKARIRKLYSAGLSNGKN